MEDLSRYYALLKDPARRKIIEILGTQEKIGFKELREALGLGVGTVYYHLDMLSDFLEQDKQRKYKLNEKGKMLYRILKEESIPASLGISETLSNRAARWLFLSPLFAKTIKPLRLLPFSLLILFLGAYGAATARLEPALFFYFEYSTRSPPSTMALFIFNWIGLFLFIEALAFMLFKRGGNELQLFTCIGLAVLPLAVFPYFYMAVPKVFSGFNLYYIEIELIRQAVLIVLQIWSLLLVSAAVCHGKGLRLDKGIMISLTAIYINIAALLLLGKLT
ncbi:MAG: winged helix-turn-helix domain-containing protein [Candidatus Bathyarchaeia archaeon]